MKKNNNKQRKLNKIQSPKLDNYLILFVQLLYILTKKKTMQQC